MHNLPLKIEKSLSDDTKLWRYIDLSKFVSLLDSKALWLARSDTFRDQREGQFPPEMRKAIEEAYEKLPKKEDSPIQNADDFQEYLCKNAYVSCWHKNVDENMVMWELYGRDSNSVAIQTTVGKLKSNISKIDSGGLEFHLKNVRYSSAEDLEGKFNYTTPFFIKRPYFSFEQEARILLSTYSAINPNKHTPIGKAIELKIEAIEKVLVHPDSHDWFVRVVESISANYGLKDVVERGIYGNK